MAKFNFLAYLNAYEDKNSSNNPSKNNFKWARELNSLPATNPTSLAFSLAPGETRTLFSGIRTLNQDNTTTYSIAPVVGTSYQLSWAGGTAPKFRTPRTSGADATTQVTVFLNGPVVTFSSTGGTAFNLTSGGVVVGDFVRIGSNFNSSNQGQWQIISLTATSFSVANPDGVAEGPILLGTGFASQVDIYSAAGVQVGDTLVISGGFSPITQGSYPITSVADGWVQFASTATLPSEGSITTEAITIYSDAQKLVYLESDQQISISINNGSSNEIMPLIDSCGKVRPGMFLNTSTIYTMSVTNLSENSANLNFIAIE